jgi:DNA-binding NarL/FixJ family response regulator
MSPSVSPRDAGLAIAALECALDAIQTAAFIFHAGGRVAHANASGGQMLKAAPGLTISRLRDAVAGRSLASARLVSRLRGPKAPGVYFVVLDAAGDDYEQRLQAVAARWQAREREIEVLRWLVQGESNKEIAQRLDCSEVTVERRVTALLRKAGCDSRNRLLAAFWSHRSLR